MADKSGPFLTYLDERFQGEVYGEAVFEAMAEATRDERDRYLSRVLEALERETKEFLARALRERDRPAEESAEQRAKGLDLGKRIVGAPRELFMRGFRTEVAKFVVEYEAAEALAPADGLAIARHVTAHERAILEFIDRDLARRASDSIEPVVKMLASPPPRSAQP